MRFIPNLIIFSSLLLVSTFAQVISIGFPADGTPAPPGSNITVEIDRPNSLSSSQEVALVIALQSCPSVPCAPPSDILGSILYNGPFNPQFQSTAPGFKPPHQNFTLQIPKGIRIGPAQLSVTHISLIGAGPAPFLEQKNITLQITNGTSTA